MSDETNLARRALLAMAVHRTADRLSNEQRGVEASSH